MGRVSNTADKCQERGCGRWGMPHNKGMKYYVSALVFGLAAGLVQAVAAVEPDSEAQLEAMAAEFRGEVSTADTTGSTSDAAATDTANEEITGEEAEKAANKTEEEKADEAKQAEARKKACETAGDPKKPDGERAAAQRKCNEVAVSTPNPQSFAKGEQYKALGKAHASMLSGELTGTTSKENLGNFKTVKIAAAPDGAMKVATNKDLMRVDSILKSDTKLVSNIGDGTTVKTLNFDAQNIRDSQGKATVVIGGDGSSYGFNPNANKYQSMRGGSVIWDDSLITTDVETARAVRFGETAMSPGADGTNYNGFNKSIGIEPGMAKRLGNLSSNQLEMAAYINARGIDLGASEKERMVAIATAMRESRFDSMVNANPNGTGAYKLYVDSSAYGLGQYINGTWVNQFDAKKMGDYVMNGGDILNRNNTTNQIDVLYNNIGQRYDSYNNSTNMQNKYTFAEYDYIHHYAGGFKASQDRIQFAVDYTRKNRLLNDTVAKYVMDADGTGDIKAGYQKSYPWVDVTRSGDAYNGVATDVTGGTNSFLNNSGLGDTIKQVLSQTGGGSVDSIVRNIMSQTGLTGGSTSSQTAALLGLLNGQGTTADMKQVLTAMLVQQLSGGSDGKSSDSKTTAKGKKDSKNDSKALKKLRSLCGGDLPKSKDAVMLMIKTCKA